MNLMVASRAGKKGVNIRLTTKNVSQRKIVNLRAKTGGGDVLTAQVNLTC